MSETQQHYKLFVSPLYKIFSTFQLKQVLIVADLQATFFYRLYYGSSLHVPGNNTTSLTMHAYVMQQLYNLIIYI